MASDPMEEVHGHIARQPGVPSSNPRLAWANWSTVDGHVVNRISNVILPGKSTVKRCAVYGELMRSEGNAFRRPAAHYDGSFPSRSDPIDRPSRCRDYLDRYSAMWLNIVPPVS
jgi:hypothetical protein